MSASWITSSATIGVSSLRCSSSANSSSSSTVAGGNNWLLPLPELSESPQMEGMNINNANNADIFQTCYWRRPDTVLTA